MFRCDQNISDYMIIPIGILPTLVATLELSPCFISNTAVFFFLRSKGMLLLIKYFTYHLAGIYK